MRKGFLRIDDFPYSGEMYAKYGRTRDKWMYRRFMRVVDTCHRYSVIPEMMVSSHLITEERTVVRFDVAVPKTTAAMREAYISGRINVNAHGMFHLDPDAYCYRGAINAREFLFLDEAETRRRLIENIRFIQEVFGKKALGFVAPAWGYNNGVTKRVASEFFLYIADSYDHWKQGACLDFGSVDTEHGFIHFPETWRYGRYENQTSIVGYWEDAMRELDCIHMMQHGFRIPGRWKVAFSINLARGLSHLFYGNLTGILEAGRRVGIEWGTLEDEALRIRKHLLLDPAQVAASALQPDCGPAVS